MHEFFEFGLAQILVIVSVVLVECLDEVLLIAFIVLSTIGLLKLLVFSTCDLSLQYCIGIESGWTRTRAHVNCRRHSAILLESHCYKGDQISVN
jgi:hypothetical protein